MKVPIKPTYLVHIKVREQKIGFESCISFEEVKGKVREEYLDWDNWQCNKIDLVCNCAIRI